ncbi:MAG: GIN domain-containing protein, partial [Flavobacteriales bacterium]
LHDHPVAMNTPDPNKDTLAALRELPTEVSLKQVETMVAAFPLAMGAMAWLIHTLKFNLNSVLMTSSASILVGTTAYLLSNTAPVTVPQAAATPEPVVITELPVAEPVAEPAVAFERPQPKKSGPEPKNEAAIACTVVQDSVPVMPPAEADVRVTASTRTEPVIQPAPAPAVTGQRTFDLRGFTGVMVASSVDVTVEMGEFSVTATGDEDLLEQLHIQLDGAMLRVDYGETRLSQRKNMSVQVQVRMPRVEDLVVAGSGSIHAERVASSNGLDLTVLGSGDLFVSRAEEARVVNLLVEGSGDIALANLASTKELTMNVRGSGGINLSQVGSTDALKIDLEGSGDVNCGMINVAGTTTISLTGSGDVQVGGRTDRVNVQLIGSGDVNATNLQARSGGRVAVTGSGDAYVFSDGALETSTEGTGEIHTSGGAGKNGSRGVGSDSR